MFAAFGESAPHAPAKSDWGNILTSAAMQKIRRFDEMAVSARSYPAGNSGPGEIAFILLLAVIAYSVCLAIVISQTHYWWQVWNSGDNAGYIRVARALTEWNPQLVGKVKLFWGTSYGISTVHLLTAADYGPALLLMSVLCGALGILLCDRLYGAPVAQWFAFVSAALMQRVLVGGAEPLFIALFLGSLLAIRRGTTLTAVLLGSLATMVRPVGIFVVAAIIVNRLRHRDWRGFLLHSGVAACMAALYLLPMTFLHVSPLANVSGYSEDWHHAGLPVSVPLYPIIKGGLESHEPLSNRVKLWVWASAVILVMCYFGVIRGRLMSHAKKYPEETLTLVLFVLFQFSYNSNWAWAEFPRFIAPAVPFLLALVCVKRLPRYILLLAAPVFGLLGAIQIVGLQKLLHALGFSGGL